MSHCCMACFRGKVIFVDSWDRVVDGCHTSASKSHKWKIELFANFVIYY
jgi:hypothetical protein